jgi:hypothetical protein
MRAFLTFILTTAQTTIAPQDNYAGLPQSLIQMTLAQVAKLLPA